MALLTTSLLVALCAAPQSPAATPDPEATPAGRETYLGREVAHTMHWAGAGWLMRATREEEENGALLREWLAVRPGQALCDLGCGNGYHTVPLADAVGESGTMFAVDLQPQMLVMLEQRTREAGLKNVAFVEATIDDPMLAPASCDLVLMVDVYHELSHPVRVMQKVKAALRERGRVVLVEFRSEDPNVPIKPEHMMSKAQVLREMASHGFELVDETDVLPWQHAMAFEAAAERTADLAPREVLRGFVAALTNPDERVLAPFLAPGARVSEGLAPPRGRSSPTLRTEGRGRCAARWPDLEVDLAVDELGRWFVTRARRPTDPIVQRMQGWTVHVDPQLLRGPHAREGARALSMLDNHLERIAILAPEDRLGALRGLEIWIEHEHPELRNMQYHPSEGWLTHHGYDRRLAKKVHIPRARALLSRAQLLKHPAVVLHELAHAYHDQVLGFDDERVIRAFRAARAARTYEDVLAHTGARVRHYALTNHKEYFAEATEAYLYRNDFYPFVRAELLEVDRGGHEVMEQIWGAAR